MKDRKSIPRTALPRIFFIDEEIASGKYPNTTTLAEKYKTGTATISRDIELMRDWLSAPIKYDYTQKGYYYTEKTFRLPGTFGSVEGIMALGMAKNLLSLYRNTPIYDAAKDLVETITAPLGEAENSHWYDERIIVPEVPLVQFAPEVWQCICEGLQKNRVLRFDYRSTWKSGYTPRRIRPYQLLFDNGAWYIYAHSIEGRGVRMYSLSRIKNISLENGTFSFPASADFCAQLGGSYFGAYSGQKKFRFRIAFYNDGAMRVQERLWAADQRIKETEDGVILEFSSTQYGKVLELVLSNGRDALPLEPAELVKDWRENLLDMQKRAKSAKK
ncbi:MAG: WYL domain-containing protein [Treponema sp.]|jgi:predicted DNA-binding transcriptional regulator YafY|nr:WYL domain-containing protein [Treponema sp.]